MRQRPPWQLRPAAHSRGGAQQSSPSPPQVSQRPPEQTEPERHSSPGQQAPPSRPQSSAGRLQTPPWQRRSLQHSALERHAAPWSEQHAPPTQSASPQQSLGSSHATPPPGTAQQSSLSQRRPAEQTPVAPQHACPTSPQGSVVRASGRAPSAWVTTASTGAAASSLAPASTRVGGGSPGHPAPSGARARATSRARVEAAKRCMGRR